MKAYKIEPKTLRTLVDWAGAGVNSMVGRAHCSAEDRALIRGFARDLGLLPPFTPEEMHKVVRAAPRPVPQIEATAKLASTPGPDAIKRRELVIHGRKAKAQAIP